MVNNTTNASENSIGVSKVMAPRHMVLTQLKTFTPVGTAINMVIYMKNSEANGISAGGGSVLGVAKTKKKTTEVAGGGRKPFEA